MIDLKFIVLMIAIFVMASCQSKELVKGVVPSDFYSDKKVIDLIFAAANGNIKRVDKLVADGVDVNAVGKDSYTPLLAALTKKNKKGVLRLLEHGADPNIVITGESSYAGKSAIWVASQMEDTYFLDVMLKYGGNPNFRNKKWYGDTLLHAAIFGDHRTAIDRVKLLVEAGADININGANESTPLIQAAAINQYEIIYYLLRQGADYKIVSKTNLSLIPLIERGIMFPKIKDGKYWRDKVVAFLREKGETVNVVIPDYDKNK